MEHFVKIMLNFNFSLTTGSLIHSLLTSSLKLYRKSEHNLTLT